MAEKKVKAESRIDKMTGLELELNILKLLDKNLKRLPDAARSRVLEYVLKATEEANLERPVEQPMLRGLDGAP